MNLSIWKNGTKQDTRGIYENLNKKDKAVIMIKGFVLQALIALCFYQSVVAFVILSPVNYIFFRINEKEKIRQIRGNIEVQFKEMLMSISASLRAGYAIENACKEALGEMGLLYGKESIIYRELSHITKQLYNNRTIESLFIELANKTRISEIREFADILVIAKKQGGNLPTIIQNTSKVIGDKIEMNREIRTIVSGKKTEQAIMNMMPIVIILYMGATSPNFFSPLYHNAMGIVIMTVCLVLYLVAYVISYKILDIKM